MKIRCDFCGKQYELSYRVVKSPMIIFRLEQISPHPQKELSRFNGRAVCINCLQKKKKKQKKNG